SFLAKADSAGIVLGARVPIILTSRADSVRPRMASCAAAVLYAHARRGTTTLSAGSAVDTILVVNAGSSSVKVQGFPAESAALERLVKGQMDGIGTRPRLRAEAADKKPLIDQTYAPEQVGNVGAALATAGAWLRETQKLEPIAVGHRVVHGGPQYDRPV